MGYSIGVDVGKTKISFVLLKNWRVVSRQKIFTPKNKKGIIKTIERNIKKLIIDIPKRDILGIGIGIPGPLNKKGDLSLSPPNLKSLRNCPLAKIIEKDLRIKTRMENDANCFTLAEAILGAGKNKETVIGITLGSGIGGGIVIKKKIFRGAFGSAGEMGHMIIKTDGFKCSCGNQGCFEEYASESFFKRKSKIFPKEIEIKAKKGDKKSKKIYQEFGQNLGIGLVNIVNILDPDIVVIGGSIAKADFLFLNQAKKEVKSRVLSPQSKKSVKIKVAKLGEFSGAIGAALLLK
jgi:glucokinase